MLATERYAGLRIIVAGSGVMGLELVGCGTAHLILYVLASVASVDEHLSTKARLRRSIALPVPSGVACGASRVVTQRSLPVVLPSATAGLGTAPQCPRGQARHMRTPPLRRRRSCLRGSGLN